MQTEEQIRKTEYAKALNRIRELENDIVKLNRNNNELRAELEHSQGIIDDLKSEKEELESQMEDQAMFTPNHKMSLIELMEMEKVVGEITLY